MTYLKLDANIWWMNRLDFRDDVVDLLKTCTVISVETKRLHEYLNRKWPLTIDYVPHGFFDFQETAEPLTAIKRMSFSRSAVLMRFKRLMKYC